MNQQVKNQIKKFIPISVLRKIRAALNQHEINRLGIDEKTVFRKDMHEEGVNLIGSFYQDSGLGQSCRLVAKEIQQTGISYSFINFVQSKDLMGSNMELESKVSDEYRYGINIWHINMHEFAKAYKIVGRDKWENHYNIAFWLWEMQEFPKEWIPLINQLDEIWTPSEFTSKAIRTVTDKPVITIPYQMEAPYDERIGRKDFGLPDNAFLYLMMFDSNSISERKNPHGVINAYKKAFNPEDTGVGLVIKIGNASESELAGIKKELNGYRVYFVNGMLPKRTVNSLIRCVDVYISLHRAEGFGLVLAEAMMLGTPTISSGYSSTTEFQTKENSCQVDSNMVTIGMDIWPYKKQYIWADPNIEQAAAYMKELKDNKELYKKIEIKAKKDIQTKGISAKLIKDRIETIYENA